MIKQGFLAAMKQADIMLTHGKTAPYAPYSGLDVRIVREPAWGGPGCCVELPGIEFSLVFFLLLIGGVYRPLITIWLCAQSSRGRAMGRKCYVAIESPDFAILRHENLGIIDACVYA